MGAQGKLPRLGSILRDPKGGQSRDKSIWENECRFQAKRKARGGRDTAKVQARSIE